MEQSGPPKVLQVLDALGDLIIEVGEKDAGSQASRSRTLDSIFTFPFFEAMLCGGFAEAHEGRSRNIRGD